MTWTAADTQSRDMDVTGICLDPGGDFTGAEGVEKGNVLTEDGLKIPLTDALRVDLAWIK